MGRDARRCLPILLNSTGVIMITDIPQYDPATERLDEINENLSLIQLKTGLTFGTDSYLLAAFAHTQKNGRALELGGGTGVVSLLAASRGKYKQIYCAEIQPYFADLIRRNARLNSLSDKVAPILTDVRELRADNVGGEVESVFSNPPYMTVESGKNSDSPEMNIARRELNGTIDDFCRTAERLLKFGGYFTVVYRPERFAELIFAMKSHSLEPKRAVLVYPSAEDKPCLVLVEAKKGGSAGLELSRPLIIYADKKTGAYTDDMNAVYDTFSLDFLFRKKRSLK